jgi:HSP20 family molecular chaperone IbpA
MSVFFEAESESRYESEWEEQDIYVPITELMPIKKVNPRLRQRLISVSVHDLRGHLIVTASLPYFTPEDIEIALRNDVLSIRGVVWLDQVISDFNNFQFSNTDIMFERHVFLPAAVRNENIDITFESGILSIVLEKWGTQD